MLNALELIPIKNTRIKILSYEQRKRVSIAVELAANPAIIFMDEPTTGLDARAAQILTRVLHRLTKSGRSIVCTIHQPSTMIFNSFDSLLLLRSGGLVIYFGEIGTNSYDLINYFQDISGVEPMGKGQNPANWILDQIGPKTYNDSNIQKSNDFHQIYIESDMHKATMIEIERMRTSEKECDSNTDTSYDTFPKEDIQHNDTVRQRTLNACTYTASEYTQISYLLKRMFTSYWRNPQYNFSRMVVSLVISFLFGSVYAQQQLRTDTDLYARVGVMYSCVMFSGTFVLCIPNFITQRT